jgi:hypothetical protein
MAIRNNEDILFGNSDLFRNSDLFDSTNMQILNHLYNQIYTVLYQDTVKNIDLHNYYTTFMLWTNKNKNATADSIFTIDRNGNIIHEKNISNLLLLKNKNNKLNISRSVAPISPNTSFISPNISSISSNTMSNILTLKNNLTPIPLYYAITENTTTDLPSKNINDYKNIMKLIDTTSLTISSNSNVILWTDNKADSIADAITVVDSSTLALLTTIQGNPYIGLLTAPISSGTITIDYSYNVVINNLYGTNIYVYFLPYTANPQTNKPQTNAVAPINFPQNANAATYISNSGSKTLILSQNRYSYFYIWNSTTGLSNYSAIFDVYTNSIISTSVTTTNTEVTTDSNNGIIVKNNNLLKTVTINNKTSQTIYYNVTPTTVSSIGSNTGSFD